MQILHFFTLWWCATIHISRAQYFRRSLSPLRNNADWCCLMLLDAAWCWLMLIDSDWFWLILIDADWCWLMIVSHRSLDNWVTFLFWQSSKLIEPVLEKSLPNPWWMTSVVNHSANDRERMSKMLRSAASHALLQCTTMHHYNPSLQPATILQHTTIQ